MVVPPNLREGQSTTRTPRFNGQYYGWWETSMHDFIMSEDCELQDMIEDDHFIPSKTIKDSEVTYNVPKTKKNFDDADRKKIEKSFKEKQILCMGQVLMSTIGSQRVILQRKSGIASKQHMRELSK